MVRPGSILSTAWIPVEQLMNVLSDTRTSLTPPLISLPMHTAAQQGELKTEFRIVMLELLTL